MSDTNPIQQVHDAFWDMLESRHDFCALVPKRCRVRYDDDINSGERGEPQERTAKSESDQPEVRLVQTGFLPHYSADSTHSNITLTFEIHVSTGRRWNNKLSAIQFAIFRALHDWITHLETLTWRGETFVRKCDPLQAKDSLDNRELNRQIRGWSCVWAGEVMLWFNISDLRSDL